MHHAKLFGWPTTTWHCFRPCFVSFEHSSTYSVSLSAMCHFYLWRFFLRLPSSSIPHSSLPPCYSISPGDCDESLSFALPPRPVFFLAYWRWLLVVDCIIAAALRGQKTLRWLSIRFQIIRFQKKTSYLLCWKEPIGKPIGKLLQSFTVATVQLLQCLQLLQC